METTMEQVARDLAEVYKTLRWEEELEKCSILAKTMASFGVDVHGIYHRERDTSKQDVYAG